MALEERAMLSSLDYVPPVADGDEALVNETVTGGQGGESVAVNSTGRMVVAWSGNGAGDDSGVFTQRYVPPATAGFSEADLALMLFVADGQTTTKSRR